MPRSPRGTLSILTAAALLGACGPAGPVAYPEHTQPWAGSRKRTLAAGETALRAAMTSAGVKLIPAPGNEEPVLVEGNCLTGGWFSLAGSPKAQLGDSFQYSWHLCVSDEQKLVVQVNCLQVTKTEKSTDSHECTGDLIAKDVATRTEQLLAQIK